MGDAVEILARIKVASEGDSVPLLPENVHRLGAPFGADWNPYPTPDKPLMLLLGGLTHVIGLFGAANLGLLLAQVTSALAFYFTARWLRCRWEWAWVGAVLFSYTYHTFHRGLAHFSFVFTWTVPLGLLAVWLVAQSRRLEWRSPGAVVCLVAAVGIGVSSPYNLYFWGQLLIWALIAQAWRERRRVNLEIGLAAGAVALLAFFVTNAEVWLHLQEPDGMPLLTRNYGGTERYALKPMEMFVPSTYHRWDLLAEIGHRYQRWSDWRGEPYLPYLGLVGMVGFVWLVGATVRRLLTRRPVPGQALSLAWLVSFSTLGGLTNLLALFLGFQLFRATNRVAIFLSAIVLLFLMVRLSRWSVRLPRVWTLALAGAILAVGLVDQLPRQWPQEFRERVAQDVQSDLELGRALEATLPAGGMVFQLPVMGFPEVTPPHRLVDYELFRPYLVTETLRFSYGAAKLRSRSRWQRDLENVPLETLVQRLESYGFSALYINRKGYEDRAEKILGELDALGYRHRLQGAGGQQVVVVLNPSAAPKLPLGRSLTFGQGWHPRQEDGVRWAVKEAALAFFNPQPAPIEAALRLELVGVTEREVVFEHNDRVVRTLRLGPTPTVLELPALRLEPGVNRFMLRSREPAKRLGTGRYQLRALGLANSSIRVPGVTGSGERRE